jgi:hypothetical protein
MFRHVAMFRFRDDVSDDTIRSIRHRLLALPDTVESIRSYEVGRDLGLKSTTWDMVVIAGFDDIDGYRAYSTHPDHVPIVEEISRLATGRAAVQTDRTEIVSASS